RNPSTSTRFGGWSRRSSPPGERYAQTFPLFSPAVLAILIALLDGFALVIELLAFGHCQFDLDSPPFQIQTQRHQGEPREFASPVELLDFIPMEQKLALPQGVVILQVSMRISRDVAVQQPDLSFAENRVTVLEIGPAQPQRLDLRAGEYHPGLHPLLDEIVVGRLAMGREILDLFLFCHESPRGPAREAARGRDAT